jgi:hypothetical protein
MIATWLVEIYLSKCNTLEDGSYHLLSLDPESRLTPIL